MKHLMKIIILDWNKQLYRIYLTPTPRHDYNRKHQHPLPSVYLSIIVIVEQERSKDQMMSDMKREKRKEILADR
jgi:hypothetical protein